MTIVTMISATKTKFSCQPGCLIWEAQGAGHNKQRKDQVTPTLFEFVMMLNKRRATKALAFVFMIHSKSPPSIFHIPVATLLLHMHYALCRSRSLCILGIWSSSCLFESNCTVVGWSLEHILQQLVFALLDEHSKYIVQGLYIWSTSYKRLRTREDAFQSALVMSTIGSRADRRRAKGGGTGSKLLGITFLLFSI